MQNEIFQNPIKTEIKKEENQLFSADERQEEPKDHEDKWNIRTILDDDQFTSKFTSTADNELNSNPQRLPETSGDNKNSSLENIPSISSHQISLVSNFQGHNSFAPLQIKKEDDINTQNCYPSPIFFSPCEANYFNLETNSNGCNFQFDNGRFERTQPLPSYRNEEFVAYSYSPSILNSQTIDYRRTNNAPQNSGFRQDDEFEEKYSNSPYFFEESYQYASFCNDSGASPNESESSEATVPDVPNMGQHVQNSTFNPNEEHKEENFSYLNYETSGQNSKQENNHLPDIGASSKHPDIRQERPTFYPEPYFHESAKFYTDDREEQAAQYDNNANQTGFRNTNETVFQNASSFDKPLQFDFVTNEVQKVEINQFEANNESEMPESILRVASEIEKDAVNHFQSLQSPILPVQLSSADGFRKDTSENLNSPLSPLLTEDKETTLDPITNLSCPPILLSNVRVHVERYIPPVNKKELDIPVELSGTDEDTEMTYSSEIEGNSHVSYHSDVPKKSLFKRKRSTSDTSPVNLQNDPQCSPQVKKETHSLEGIPPPKKAKKQFICKNCNKVYVREHFFIKHMQSYSSVKAYACKDCDKTFPTKSSLTAHRKSHSNEVLVCDACDRVYVRIWCFEKHRSTHLVLRIYMCLNCFDAFTNKSARDAHARRRHSDLALEQTSICAI